MIRMLFFIRMDPDIGLNWNTTATVAILLNLLGHFVYSDMSVFNYTSLPQRDVQLVTVH